MARDWSHISVATPKAAEIALEKRLLNTRNGVPIVVSREQAQREGLVLGWKKDNILWLPDEEIEGGPPFSSYKISGELLLTMDQLRDLIVKSRSR